MQNSLPALTRRSKRTLLFPCSSAGFQQNGGETHPLPVPLLPIQFPPESSELNERTF